MKDRGLKMWLLQQRGKATELLQEWPVTKNLADELKRAAGLETRCLDSMFYLQFRVILEQSWKKTHRFENNLIAFQPDECPPNFDMTHVGTILSLQLQLKGK